MTETIVSTQSGEVAGRDQGGILAFKGIPYAAPPVGALRFAPPAPVEPWSEPFDAREYGPSCPQPEARPEGWSPETHEDEDCLRLNVWAPASDGGKRPVMVFFHGGGYTIGSGSWPLYEGRSLAARGDVVVVTVNHRLGPFGYLHLAELGGPELASSGNVGMQDLVVSLEWVRDNIAGFGGDPDNVMIFGESGGGSKVCHLLAMPSAKGLFHRAAIQSGAARYSLAPERAGDATEKLLEKLGIDAGPGAVDKLRALPAEALRTAGGRGMGGDAASPVLDGEVIARHPAHALRDGHAPDVPLLIGTTFDEATLFLGAEPALRDPSKLGMDELPARLSAFGDRAEPLLEAYKASRPDADAITLLLAINTDASMRIPSIKLAEKRLQGVSQAPVWMYIFCWAAGPLRSGHGFELPFCFDNVHEPVMRPSPSRKELGARMADAWIAFARGGDPNHDGLPPWGAYDTDRRTTMLFDRGECRAESDPWGAERQAWFK
ncbi:MAG: carboxylesterase/lipase family protein [Myxococcales bacterium]|nr:carboxylesterase/lipase family protein [Myxococcales bacterium]